jgi:hypothetical protein
MTQVLASRLLGSKSRNSPCSLLTCGRFRFFWLNAEDTGLLTGGGCHSELEKALLGTHLRFTGTLPLSSSVDTQHGRTLLSLMGKESLWATLWVGLIKQVSPCLWTF